MREVCVYMHGVLEKRKMIGLCTNVNRIPAQVCLTAKVILNTQNLNKPKGSYASSKGPSFDNIEHH
jgi:hypothetical protein